MLEWKEKYFASEIFLLIVMAAIEVDVFKPGCDQAAGINVSWIHFNGVDSDFTTFKECFCSRMKVLGMEAALEYLRSVVVLRDVSLIDVDAFSGAVSKNLVDGVRFDLRNLMVGISIAKVVACGVHVVFCFLLLM